MPSVLMNTPLEDAGFVKLAGNKYLVRVAGFSTNGTLEMPENVYDELDGEEDFFMKRARVAIPAEETLGQFSGQLTELAAVDNLPWGTRVPGIQELASQRHRLTEICITFADDDTPMSAEATGFKKVDRGAGFTTYHDSLDR